MKFEKTKIKIFFIIGLVTLIAITCKKDNAHIIPYVSVNIILSIPTELSVLPVGSTMDYSGGVKGITIYRNSDNEFTAFERLCAYYPSDTCTIVTDVKGGVTATCPCCKSQFEFVYGSVVKGPATFPLKQYQTIVDGSRLYIRN